MFGSAEVTTGASSDLERATELARKMVTEYGMSSELGPMVFGEREELVFLGRSMSEHRNYSESVARKIDIEIRAIIQVAYQRALAVMSSHRELLDKLAQQLIQKETLGEEDFEALLEGAAA
mgnify:FL=1